MIIEPLGKHAELIPLIANWHFQQWGPSAIEPQQTVEWRIADLKEHLNKTTLPLTFVAFSGSVPVGSACLTVYDLPIRQNLSPWLSTVFVLKEFRKQGIGSALVKHVVEKARALDFPQLYLFTPDQVKLYSRLGWNIFEEVVFHEHEYTIMKIELGEGFICKGD